MKRVQVSYRVKEDRVEENKAFIRAVFEELEQAAPDGLRYASFYAGEGRFVHIASIETDDGSNPLSATAAFPRFQAELKDRCIEPPAAVPLETIGSFRLLD